MHIKRIEEAPEGKGFGYQVFTYESLDLLGKDYWAQGTGGYSWVSEKYREGWWGVEIQKIVFADGYELWFTNGDINRDLLLQAPKFSGSHGNILAEGVVTLNPQETRKLIGEETYNLGYKVKKRQAKLGLAKTLVSAPVVLLCVWKKDNKEDKCNKQIYFRHFFAKLFRHFSHCFCDSSVLVYTWAFMVLEAALRSCFPLTVDSEVKIVFLFSSL